MAACEHFNQLRGSEEGREREESGWEGSETSPFVRCGNLNESSSHLTKENREGGWRLRRTGELGIRERGLHGPLIGSSSAFF